MPHVEFLQTLFKKAQKAKKQFDRPLMLASTFLTWNSNLRIALSSTKSIDCPGLLSGDEVAKESLMFTHSVILKEKLLNVFKL